jgi:hypothetical protein
MINFIAAAISKKKNTWKNIIAVTAFNISFCFLNYLDFFHIFFFVIAEDIKLIKLMIKFLVE